MTNTHGTALARFFVDAPVAVAISGGIIGGLVSLPPSRTRNKSETCHGDKHRKIKIVEA
jgi:hypothetical protein